MNGRSLFCAAFLMAFFWAVPARADIDQLCLKQCVANGGASGACLKQCTYGQVETPVIGAAAAASSTQPNLSQHRILNAPVPADSGAILPKKQAPAAPDEDYACLQKCLNSGVTIGLCDEHCTKTQGTSETVLKPNAAGADH
jgi:hypothetical protein